MVDLYLCTLRFVREGGKTLIINPLNWKTDGTPADEALNLGACFTDYSRTIAQEIPCLTGAYTGAERGALKVTDVTAEQYPGIFFPESSKERPDAHKRILF